MQLDHAEFSRGTVDEEEEAEAAMRGLQKPSQRPSHEDSEAKEGQKNKRSNEQQVIEVWKLPDDAPPLISRPRPPSSDDEKWCLLITPREIALEEVVAKYNVKNMVTDLEVLSEEHNTRSTWGYVRVKDVSRFEEDMKVLDPEEIRTLGCEPVCEVG